MRYMRIEENAMDHPKFIAISAHAWRLWCEGGTYCQKHLTDGRLPVVALKGFRYYRASALKELVTVNVDGHGPLWHQDGEFIVVNDYLDWNDSREKVLANRKAGKDRLERWRTDQAAKRGDTSPRETPTGNGVSNGERNATQRNGTERSQGKDHPARSRASGAGNRNGVGAGSFPGDHLDHLACGPVCFTPRMTAKFIGRFGTDRGRLETWARGVCDRETERVEAGQAVTQGDDFAYWTAAYDAEFSKPPERVAGGRHIEDADTTAALLARRREERAAAGG